MIRHHSAQIKNVIYFDLVIQLNNSTFILNLKLLNLHHPISRRFLITTFP